MITTLNGEFVDHVGGNGPKLIDGDYETCCFNRPQGLCFDAVRNAVFVADTENHALRMIELTSKTVHTLAGNGYQGRDYKGGSKGKLQQLSSPWDVEVGPSVNHTYDIYPLVNNLAHLGIVCVCRHGWTTSDLGVQLLNPYHEGLQWKRI